MVKIDDYKKGDEKQILDLFSIVFKKQMSFDYWQWRFESNVLNKTIIKLAWDGDKLISHYAVCPVNMIIDDDNVEAALSMTTMTHPDYNGQGLFPKLADELYNTILDKEEFSFVYGFPNQNSHFSFVNKLGWNDLALIPQFSFNLSNFSGYPSESVRYFSNFELRHEIAARFFLDEYKIKLHRNIEYFEWRYNKCPQNIYKKIEKVVEGICYFVVFKEYKTINNIEIDICEIFVPPDMSQMRDFINFIYLSYLPDKLSKINIWVSLYDSKFSVLEKIGFKYTEPITFLGYKSNNYTIIEQDFYYSMGDSDVF